MMKNIYTILNSKLIVTMILLFLFSCSESTKSTQKYENIVKQGDDIIPMNIGNQWAYSVEEYESNELINEYELNVEIIDSTLIEYENDSISVFVFKENKKGDENSILYYLLNKTENGIYWWGHSVHGNIIGGENDSYYYKKQMYLECPPEIGDTWIHDHGDYQDNFVCLAVNDSVYIDEELFTCIKIRMGNSITWYVDSYYAKGVGLIKKTCTIVIDGSSEITRQRLLKRNTLKSIENN